MEIGDILWPFGTFYDHFVHFVPFGTLCKFWYIFPGLVSCNQEKSGNPGMDSPQRGPWSFYNNGFRLKNESAFSATFKGYLSQLCQQFSCLWSPRFNLDEFKVVREAFDAFYSSDWRFLTIYASTKKSVTILTDLDFYDKPSFEPKNSSAATMVEEDSVILIIAT
jgi:hypothetical protein